MYANLDFQIDTDQRPYNSKRKITVRITCKFQTWSRSLIVVGYVVLKQNVFEVTVFISCMLELYLMCSHKSFVMGFEYNGHTLMTQCILYNDMWCTIIFHTVDITNMLQYECWSFIWCVLINLLLWVLNISLIPIMQSTIGDPLSNLSFTW